jgi:hypothetical protein
VVERYAAIAPGRQPQGKIHAGSAGAKKIHVLHGMRKVAEPAHKFFREGDRKAILQDGLYR